MMRITRECINALKPVIRIISIRYGPIRNYIGLGIRLKNLAPSWKRICAQFMTLPEDRGMNCGKYRISE
jgi:hypothetical protein